MPVAFVDVVDGDSRREALLDLLPVDSSLSEPTGETDALGATTGFGELGIGIVVGDEGRRPSCSISPIMPLYALYFSYR